MVASQSSPGFVRIRRLKAVEPLALEHSKASRCASLLIFGVLTFKKDFISLIRTAATFWQRLHCG